MRYFRPMMNSALAIAVVLSAGALTLGPAIGKGPSAEVKRELGDALRQFKDEARKDRPSVRRAPAIAGKRAVVKKPPPRLAAAQRRLQNAISSFERSVGGMQNPACKACRNKQNECVRRCRTVAKGQTEACRRRCIEEHATCLYCSRFAGDPSPLYTPVRWGSTIGCGV